MYQTQFTIDDTSSSSSSAAVGQSDAVEYIHNNQLLHKLQVQEPALNLTYVNALSDRYDIAVSHASLRWSEQDVSFFTSAAGETVFSQLALIPEPGTVPNLASITVAERLLKVLFTYFDSILAVHSTMQLQDDARYKDAWRLLKQLEDALYPWIYSHWDNVFHINNQTGGRGILLCVGNNQFKYPAISIRAIRQIFHSTLPIEVFFIRDSDLQEAKRHCVKSEFQDVHLVRLEDHVSDYYTKFGGWVIKLFAMLASKYTEVIMMDADVFFFQDPGMLFQDEGYKATGSLFCYDRTLFRNKTKGPDWMRSFLPSVSLFVPYSRWSSNNLRMSRSLYAFGDDWELKPGCLKNKNNIYVLDPQQKSYALASIELDKRTIADLLLLEKGEWDFKDTMD